MKPTETGGPCAYNVSKKLSSRKGHVLVDTTGQVFVVVLEDNIQDREGIPLLLAPIKEVFPQMKKIWVDQGYTGKGREWIKYEMGWEVQVDGNPRRWREMLGASL